MVCRIGIWAHFFKKTVKMKYAWLFTFLLLGIYTPVCYAETQTGEIKNAEFVIEKQKKNKVNQEERLFFKAPIPATKKPAQPLAEIQDLTVEVVPFEPTPETHTPFNFQKKHVITPFNHYWRLGIASLILPYVDLALYNYSFLQGIWSTHIAFIPELFNQKSRKGILALKGKYTIGSWIFQPNFHYQNDWYKNPNPTQVHDCIVHQADTSTLFKKATESATQDGKISCNWIVYHHEKIKEDLVILQYKWIKILDNFSIKVGTYNDIAFYTNGSTKQTRTIISVAPGLIFTLPKETKLKAGLRIAYHNDPVDDLIPNFDLYPMTKISHPITTWLTPYIGIKGMGAGGSVHPLHLHNLVEKNPFIAQNCRLSHHHQYLKLYGGGKGTVSANLAYHLCVAYHKRKNLSRMITTDDYSTYELCYNPENHNVLKSTGIVDYIIPQAKLKTTLKGVYYTYFKNEAAPIWWYNKPKYKIKPTLTYRPHPKIALISNLIIQGETVVKNKHGDETKLDNTIDIALNGDYFFSKRFTAFILINNLLNRKNTSYTGFSRSHINITGGIQYKW